VRGGDRKQVQSDDRKLDARLEACRRAFDPHPQRPVRHGALTPSRIDERYGRIGTQRGRSDSIGIETGAKQPALGDVRVRVRAQNRRDQRDRRPDQRRKQQQTAPADHPGPHAAVREVPGGDQRERPGERHWRKELAGRQRRHSRQPRTGSAGTV
jgi:hypothetical protein